MIYVVFFFNQKTGYDMRISDWSSDVCSSDLLVFNINAQGFIPLALPRQKQSAFADTRINNQSALFNVRAYDRELKFADVVRGTDGRLFFVLVEVVAIDPIHKDRKRVV